MSVSASVVVVVVSETVVVSEAVVASVSVLVVVAVCGVVGIVMCGVAAVCGSLVVRLVVAVVFHIFCWIENCMFHNLLFCLILKTL